MPETCRLYTIPGSGGMIVEAGFALADVPVDIVRLEWEDLGWRDSELSKLNPLGQVPTLILPDGSVMTESAAILLYLSDIRPQSGLAPAATDAGRPAFLRWLIFIASAVYPTFTYGDVPGRWVGDDEAAGAKLRTGTDEHREMLYRYMESNARRPWFLGERFSALDLYFLTMRHWRPGTAWFAKNCPKLDHIGIALSELPAVKKVLDKYYGPNGEAL